MNIRNDRWTRCKSFTFAAPPACLWGLQGQNEDEDITKGGDKTPSYLILLTPRARVIQRRATLPSISSWHRRAKYAGYINCSSSTPTSVPRFESKHKSWRL